MFAVLLTLIDNFQRPHSGYRLNGKRPIEVLLDKTTCPKRLAYDKIDAPTNVEVSTDLQACTVYISTKRAAKRAPSEARRLRRAKRGTGDTAGRDLAPDA